MQTGKAVVVIVVVVIVGWVILRHGPSSTHAAAPSTTHPTTATTAAPTPTTTPLVPPASIKLQVLNGVLVGSLAGEWSAKLHANPGYDTLPALNATAKVAQSVIYIVTPGFQREANALAVAVGLPVTAVNTTIPPPASAPIPPQDRASANLILVIGPDLASSA
jgi:hypothetical protein